MTITPRDAIGLSDRLREVRKQLAPHVGKKWLKPIDEAATQLDALSAMVKELEAERDQMAGVLASPLADKVVEYADRATRAEQERDALEETARRHEQTLKDNGIGSHTEAVVLVVDLRQQLQAAKQERDEAYERAARYHDGKIESTKEWAAVSPSKSRAIAAGATINVHRESAAAIRRLAGPEKEEK